MNHKKGRPKLNKPIEELIELIYEKEEDFHTIYNLSKFCRTIKIFSYYFDDYKNITQEIIINFCYNLLIKNFEKGKKIEID